MNIIRMNLDDFGIYHNVSWTPPERGLIVMHGQNESGKTTLMKYVRSMFFGYPRGEWKGYFGHMDIRRENGKEYTIYRKEKESYITDGDQTLHEEPADLWWHSLDHNTYDKIFAMGLEDLQGFKILSNEDVRSHFFSIEGGVRMGLTRRDFTQKMGELLVASPQGKKPINMLLQEQREFERKISHLSYDEDEFADLQEKEKQTHDVEKRLRLSIEETKQQIEKVAMPLAAWDVYKRGQEAMKHMQDLAEVSQFPADAAQRWSDLENKLRDVDEKIKEIEASIRKEPAFKPEWNRWVICGPQIDALYHKVPQWQQALSELETHEAKEMDWQYDENKSAQEHKQWTETTVPEHVEWTRPLSMAQHLATCIREEEKWQAAKPKNVSAPLTEADPSVPERTREEWQELGKAVVSIQESLSEREKVQDMLALLRQEPAETSHAFFALGLLFVVAAIGLVTGIFQYDLDQTIGGAAAAVCLVLAGAAFLKQRANAHRRPRRMEELEGQLARIQTHLAAMAEDQHMEISIADDNERWTQCLDHVRKQYMDWKTRETKDAWSKEQQVMYDAIYQKWEADGQGWEEKLENCRKAWAAWQAETGFTKLDYGQVQEAKEVWDAYQTAHRSLQERHSRKDALLQQIAHVQDETEQIFREVGLRQDVSPDGIEAMYQQWQTIRVQAEVAREQDRQQEEQKQELEKWRKDKEIRLHQQTEILQETGSQTAGEFRSKVLKFRQFHQYKEVYEQSEAHLKLIAKQPKNLAQLRHELKIHDVHTWQEEKTYYERKIADTEKKLADVAEKRGSIVERLSQMAKSEESSRLLQEKENRKAVLDTATDEWLTCLFAQYMLGEAQAYYERVRQPQVIRQAGDYLHLMTQGRYTLQASFDGRQLFAVDGTGRRIPEKQWSSGTADQVYLAIRLSLAMAFSRQIEPMPIILDDILVRFDEQRQQEALRFLADLGKTEQIFLFTCSKETRDLAASVQQLLAGETDTIHMVEIEQGKILAG